MRPGNITKPVDPEHGEPDLLERLREHASLHDELVSNGADDEQRLWADDLREAADEIERLRSALRYEQNRSDRIGTHGPDCYTWGPAHYECAMREIDGLSEVAAESELNREGIKHAHAELRRLRERIEKAPVGVLSRADVGAWKLPDTWSGKTVRLVVEED